MTDGEGRSSSGDAPKDEALDGLPHVGLTTLLRSRRAAECRRLVTVFLCGRPISQGFGRFEAGLHRKPLQTVTSRLHPAAPRDLNKVVSPTCGRPSNASSSGAWPPLGNLPSPSVISSTSYVACLSPLQRTDSLSYVVNTSSLTDHRISDHIP